jgi:predicted unusual protein kinase regulating ubiquinone biosynthesis (AarF/ABC1/UbiB family)/DNA-binding XRE family transcriptional regulator
MPRHRLPSERKSEAERLTRVRAALALNQRELADVLKVAPAAVTQWEKGQRTVPGPVLQVIESYEEELGLSPPTSTGWPPRSGLASRARGGLALALRLALYGILADRWASSALAARARWVVATRLVDQLCRRKGLVMKLGQVLATVDVAFPEEVRARLEGRTAAVPAMPPALVAQLIFEALGATPRRLFARWSPQPFAVASLGQVHRAMLPDGTLVAVKVQFPRIVEVLERDLAQVAWLERHWAAIFREQAPNVVFTEVRDMLLAECDYVREAEQQERFRRAFAGRPDLIIPRVIADRSCASVLTMEYIDGLDLDSFLRTSDPAARARAGERIWQFFYEGVFHHNLFHADPHAGNFLFCGDAVAVLDFGRVRTFAPGFLAWWRSMLRAVIDGDRAEEHRLITALGLVKQPTAVELALLQRIFQILYAPYRRGADVAFDVEYIRRTWQAFVTDNPLKLRMNLRGELIALSQLQWGVSAILARLGARADWNVRIQHVLDSAPAFTL